MLRSLTYVQLVEWMAYAQLEPFGEERADYRAASIVAMLANLHRDTTRHPEPFALADFLLRFDGEAPTPKKPRQSWQQQKAIGKMLADLYNMGD